MNTFWLTLKRLATWDVRGSLAYIDIWSDKRRLCPATPLMPDQPLFYRTHCRRASTILPEPRSYVRAPEHLAGQIPHPQACLVDLDLDPGAQVQRGQAAGAPAPKNIEGEVCTRCVRGGRGGGQQHSSPGLSSPRVMGWWSERHGLLDCMHAAWVTRLRWMHAAWVTRLHCMLLHMQGHDNM